MTTLSELLSALLGWLADLATWIVGWVPRYLWVRTHQTGVLVRGTRDPVPLERGVLWHVPNLDYTHVVVTSRQVLQVAPVAVQTPEGFAVKVGCAIAYRVADPVKYLIETWDVGEAMAEYAQGAITAVVTTEDWSKLMGNREGGTWLGKRLEQRLTKELERFGVEVESVRPTDQVRLRGAFQVFGIEGPMDQGVA